MYVGVWGCVYVYCIGECVRECGFVGACICIYVYERVITRVYVWVCDCVSERVCVCIR